MTFLLDLATQTILLSLFLFFTAQRQRKAIYGGEQDGVL